VPDQVSRTRWIDSISLRILDVSPIAVCPPRRGSAVRTYNLLRHLSRSHEVRQFSLGWDDPPVLRPQLEHTRPAPTYEEQRYRHPVNDAFNALTKRSWVSAPVLSGISLTLTRPPALDRLLSWADIVLVEFVPPRESSRGVEQKTLSDGRRPKVRWKQPTLSISNPRSID